jgi:ribonucleotide monophosphatase NagD (HAD superfamily)
VCGARAGVPTALVLTGVSRRDEIESAEAKPTYVFDDLPALMQALLKSPATDRQPGI